MEEAQNGFIGKINAYVASLPQDKQFAWLAVLIGFLLVILSLLL